METNKTEASDQAESSTSTPTDIKEDKSLPKSKSKLRLFIPRIAIATLALAIVGTGIYFGISTYTKLKDENSDLSKELSAYQDLYARYVDRLSLIDVSDEQLKQRLLSECSFDTTTSAWQDICEKLKNGTEKEVQDIIDQYSSGTIIQTNFAIGEDHAIIPDKYIGGKYAPYWVLHGLNITIPNGIAMERTVSIWSDDILGKFDDEGFNGCGGSGIRMSVATDIVSSKKTFIARAHAQSHESMLSCGVLGHTYISYANHEILPKYPDKTFMEVVTYDCLDDTYEDNAATIKSCASGNYDTKTWRLHSGIISTADAGSIVPGAVIDGIELFTYVGDAKSLSFNIHCSNQDDPHYAYSAIQVCDSNFSSYEQVLAHSEYKELKNIILTLQKN